MVFSSLYLDPPNWQQHPNQQVLQGSSGSGGNNHDQNQHLIPPPPLPQPNNQSSIGIGSGGGGGPGGLAIRPNSMAERARLAKIPPPDAPQKCPRCDSTNTKFCYFNNYSLSQPRHFCKTCRRYWTRGGALRNVPVGGGCRRNKRSSSKSSSGGGSRGGSSSSNSSLTSPTTLVGEGRIPLHMDLVSTTGLGPTIPGIPSGVGGTLGMSSFMASLQNIAQLGMGNLGLNFGGPPQHPLGGLTGGPHGGGGGGGTGDHLDFPQLNPSSTNHTQVQFPNFLGGFEIPGSSHTGGSGAGLYTSTFQNDHQNIGDDHNDDHDHQGNIGLTKTCSSDMTSQFAPIKTEDVGQGLNLHKQFINNNNNNATSNQFWGGNNIGNNTSGATNMWTDLSGLNSSSTSHLL